MKRFLISAVTAGALLTTEAAVAETVNVDFDGGITTSVEDIAYRPYPEANYLDFGTQAIYWENGVRVRGVTYEVLSDRSIDYDNVRFFPTISDTITGYDPFHARFMEISLEGNQLFDLKRIGTGGTYSGGAIFTEFTPASGGSQKFSAFPIFGPTVALIGTKADGTVVRGTGTTTTAANLQPGDIYYFDPIDVLIPDEVLATFTNLKTLVLRTYGYYQTGLEEQYRIARYSLEQYGAAPEILQALETCGLYATCTIEGLGTFSSFYDPLAGGRNDAVNFGVTDFDIHLSEEEMPAPVPLPAAAWFLIAGLGALGMTRLRKKA